MRNGKISGNTTLGSGGGVSVTGFFNMHSGEISGNNASSSGGGVYVVNSGMFRISNGVILGSEVTGGNTAVSSGAALYGTASRGRFNGSTFNEPGVALGTTNNTIWIEDGEIVIP